MIEVFASNQTMVTNNTQLVITTDFVPLGSANYATAVLNLHKLFHIGGGANVDLNYQGEGSNDRQSWFEISGLTDSKNQSSPTGPSAVPADVTPAFLRIKFTLSVTGASPGDWGAAVFDLHVDLIHK